MFFWNSLVFSMIQQMLAIWPRAGNKFTHLWGLHSPSTLLTFVNGPLIKFLSNCPMCHLVLGPWVTWEDNIMVHENKLATKEIKLKNFCTTKETISKVKRQPSEWEKIITNEATDKELISKIYKQLLQLNSRKKKKPSQKTGQRAKQTFLQRRHTDG